MDLGRWFVFVGLFASVVSIAAYAVALRGRRAPLLAGRCAAALGSAMAVAAFLRLMSLMVGKRFEYRYVFDYSSADLHGPFLYSATWAGQEGSFLLWAACTAILGMLVMWKAGRWEARVMPVFVSSLVFLFGIMAWLDPYALIPLQGAMRPSDGAGLNPSLQNYWMAIHPPTIFFGFVALSVPFSYAVAALAWRDYAEWSRRVMPWVLLAVGTLGVGLFMGGYWAYETQGWHGFWAWDPVENASLFPWLGSLALCHGLIVQRVRGGMAKTNLLLAIASWALFVYGTFLTRSGVLSSFSVHAFGMLDSSALKLLLWMIGIHVGGGLALLVLRWRTIPGRPMSDHPVSRDAAMAAAVALMMAAALVVAIGTSWPLISRIPAIEVLAKWFEFFPALSKAIAGLHSKTGVRVEPIFYNRVGATLVIPGLIVMGVVPFLSWARTDPEKLLWQLIGPWLAAVAFAVGVLLFALHEASTGFAADTPRIVTVTICLLGFFSVFANARVGWRALRAQRSAAGGWIAHMGVGLLCAGALISNVYEKTSNYAVVEGQAPVPTAFGYTLEFAGWTHDGKPEDEVRKDWRRFDHAVKVRVRPSGAGQADGYTARVAVFKYWDSGKEDWATMTWPDIRKQAHRDIYLAAADDPRIVRASATLSPGETSTIGVPGMEPTGYSVKYTKLYSEGASGGMPATVGAEMVLSTPDGRTVAIRPGLSMTGGARPEPINVAIPELGGAAIVEGGISAETRAVTVAFELPDAPAIWVVWIAATNKPMVNLVWIGVLLIGLGSAVAMVRRSIEARPGREEQPAAA